MAEAPAHDYPTIEPTSFDVVICGTGLPESVLAAAGKTVLHVDPNPFYGSIYSSVLPSFLSPDPSPSSSLGVVCMFKRSWREHLVLYCRALHLMNIWTTGVIKKDICPNQEFLPAVYADDDSDSDSAE